jgi:hypothetical protein
VGLALGVGADGDGANHLLKRTPCVCVCVFVATRCHCPILVDLSPLPMLPLCPQRQRCAAAECMLVGDQGMGLAIAIVG